METKIKKIYNFIRDILKSMKKDHISEYSAQCAYYAILSFIPLLILLMTMVQYTGLKYQTIVDAITSIVPSSMNSLVIGVVQEIYSKSIGTVSISLIFVLWTAGKSWYALTKGLQEINEVDGKIKTNYFYLRLKAVIQTIIFIVAIVISLTLLVFGKSLTSIIKEDLGKLNNYNVIYNILTGLAFVFGTFILFLILYKLIPRNKNKLRYQSIGAIIGAISLNILSFIFSIYLDVFKGFSIMYGSLTTLILIMMWTYACFYTIFLGAEINKVIIKKVTGNKREGKNTA